MLCGRHFAKNTGGDRPVEIVDNMRFDPGRLATNQVDVGLRHNRANDQVAIGYHVAQQFAALGKSPGPVLFVSDDKMARLFRNDRQVVLAAPKVGKPLGQISNLISEHFGLDSVNLSDAVKPLLGFVKLGFDNRNPSVKRRVVHGNQRLTQSDRGAPTLSRHL